MSCVFYIWSNISHQNHLASLPENLGLACWSANARLEPLRPNPLKLAFKPESLSKLWWPFLESYAANWSWGLRGFLVHGKSGCWDLTPVTEKSWEPNAGIKESSILQMDSLEALSSACMEPSIAYIAAKILFRPTCSELTIFYIY